jgi:tetratricopeptide (TPR) repeat protein
METFFTLTGMNSYCGARQEASALLVRLLELSAEIAPEALMERTWSSFAQGIVAFFFDARPWHACAWLEEGYRGFIALELERNSLGVQVLWAHALEALGDRANAEARLRENLASAQRLNLLPVAFQARLNLALLLAGSTERAQREEALVLANEQQVQGPGFFSGLAYTLKAKVAANRGDLDEAETWARQACEALAPFLYHQRTARTLLTQVLLAQGRAAEAREVAGLGVQRLEQCGSEGAEAVGLRLALAEACLAGGDSQTGEAALRQALQCLRTRAGDIPDAAARERFLQQVPENARTLELARQRWGTAEVP